mmetsp:Transcript_9596/g.30757  ORF Transcript_9596/g.30757 Transcript_9596/m.30757 type:complete len:203 (-) Transcript_9596:855-1463(-)
MYEAAKKNRRRGEPLAVAVKEVEELRHQLKDFEKDQTSLKYATSRLKRLRAEFSSLEAGHKELEANFKLTEKQRDQIYDTFEDTISDVQRRSEFKNVVLQQRLHKLQTDQDERLQQIRSLCAEVDPVMLSRVTSELDQVIDQRNALIKDMEYHLALVHKTHNDTVRTLSEKLQEFGIPEEDAAVAKLIPTRTSMVPAGLVTK